MKTLKHFLFSYLICITQVIATPGVPGDDEFRSAREEIESQVSDGTSSVEDINEIRELITSSEDNINTLLDRASNQAKGVVDQVGEVFTPDRLLAGSVAAVAGLKIGTEIVDGFLGITSNAIGYVTQKLFEDIEKINYEIFYKHLFELDEALKHLDKVVAAANKAEELIRIKERISPLFNERVGEQEIKSFVDRVSCDSSLNALQQAEIRSNLSGLIERFQGPEYSMRNLCSKLAQMDELESKIDSIGRLLSIYFNDMKEYRIRKVRNEAERSYAAWLERVETSNPFIDELRDEAISCLSDPEKIRGTRLEAVASHPSIVRSLQGKPFNFVKVWNHYFSSHETAFENGNFSRNMEQDQFLNALHRGEQIWEVRCGAQRLKKCATENAQSYASSFSSDSQVYRALLRSHAKVKRGEDLGASERAFYERMIHQINPESMQIINAPFGNMILSTGPTSVNIFETRVIEGVIPSTEISDINSLSCEHEFIRPSHRGLCRVMLQGMNDLVQGACRNNFVDNDIESRGAELLEREKEKKRRDIPLAVLKERNKLRRLENFVDMLSSSDTNNLERTLRRLADKHDAYIESGMCQRAD